MSATKMTQSELVDTLYERVSKTIQKRDIKILIKELNKTIVNTVAVEGRSIELYGVGSIKPFTNKARVCHNPITKVKFTKGETKTAKLRLSKRFKELLK